MADLYYSQRCPDCANPNDPPADRCSKCGTVTSWPSSEDFREYMLQTKRRAVLVFLKGAAELFLGLFFSATVLVVLREAAQQGFLFLCILMLLVTITVGIHGGIQMKRSTRGLLFE